MVILKADKSNEAPEVDALLSELGNTAGAIPYYGLFQPGEEPIHFDGVFVDPDSFLSQLGAQQLSEAWGQSKESPVKLDQKTQPDRTAQMPNAAAN